MKNKVRKLILLIACGIAAYAAISHALHARDVKKMQAEIAVLRQTLREQGFKTEFADFTVTTDPAMQVRVKALLAVGIGPRLDASDDLLNIRPLISNGVAKVLWRQPALTLGNNAYQWTELRAELDKEQERLNAACDATQTGPIQFDLDTNSNAFLPEGSMRQFQSPTKKFDDHALRLHRLARTLGDRALLELHDGHPDAAWMNLLAATRLVTAWQAEPVPISQLRRSAMTYNDFALTWQALQFSPWPDDRLAALQREWESADLFANLSGFMGLEVVKDSGYFQKLLQKPSSGVYPFFGIVKGMFNNPAEALREADENYQLKHYRGTNVLADEKNMLLYFQDRELELRRALQATTWAELEAQPGITNPPPFTSPMPYTASVVNSLARNTFALTARAAVAEAERRILITAIALERYHGKYGSYPNSLVPLTPEFLKVPLPDFMDGQPLRYHPTADGHFILYSVGLDCVDDGGKPPAPVEPRMDILNFGGFTLPIGLDLVWAAPASP